MKEEELRNAANEFAFNLDTGDLNTNRDTFIAGAEWMKAQLIKDAIKWLKSCLDNGMWIANDVGKPEKDAIIENLIETMSGITFEQRAAYWSECKGTKQPIIEKCNGCPMFTVRDDKPICLYGK